MRIKIVNELVRTPEGELYNRGAVVNAETGEILEFVESVKIELGQDGCRAIISFINPDLAVEVDDVVRV